MIRTKRILAFSTILSLLILSYFNAFATFSISTAMTGISATFDLDEEDPLEYAAIIPEPNLYTTMSVDGYNQGEFSILNATGDTLAKEVVNFPGKDISYLYPWNFDDYMLDSTTNNNYTDPWDIRWLNISAFEAENEILSPFTVSTLWNYYSMSETESLQIPLNSSIPIQVDIDIRSEGPKLLKYEWLTNNPNLPIFHSMALISPNGKELKENINMYENNPRIIDNWAIFPLNYWGFVAHEIGIYRLLINASHTISTFLSLEFLNYEIESLNQDELVIDGTGDETPNWEDVESHEWTSKWYRFSAEKGDFFKLNLGLIYSGMSMGYLYPNINIWTPCENGYRMTTITGNFGPNLIFVPTDGDVYINIDDLVINNVMRYSLYLTKLSVMQWDPTSANTVIRISKDEYKVLNFSIDEDSFIRINTTAYRGGNPEFGDGSSPYRFYYTNSKKLTCYDLIDPLLTKTVDAHSMYYYYLPAGEYKTLVYNTDQSKDGFIQIRSQIVENAGTDIPINNLNPSNPYPKHFTTVEFHWDDYFHSLKEAKWFSFDITEQGIFKLNTTITASDNPWGIGKRDPDLLFKYDPKNNYSEYIYGQKMFYNNPHSSDDAVYIGTHSRYTGIEFGMVGTVLNGEVALFSYNSSGNWQAISYIDGTNQLDQDGIMEFKIKKPFFETWVKGINIDFPNITNEEDYYWLSINCTKDYNSNKIPILSDLSVLNTTISGDLNFALIKDSEYQYCDFWESFESSSGDLDIEDLRFGKDEDLTSTGSLHSDTESLFILNNESPYTIGFEPGEYKLLVVPENWSHSGHINVRFAIENYWERNARSWYNITKEPSYHGFQITKHPGDDPNLISYGSYSFDHIVGFNSSLYNWTSSNYYIMSCYGERYKWTQLIVKKDWISKYNLYLMQDIPWINNNGPNNEVIKLAEGVTANGSVFEFGTLNSFFALIFEFNGTEENVRFRLDVSQYPTPHIRAFVSSPGISSFPFIPSNILVASLLILALIGIAATVTLIIMKIKR